jgi:RNA polymerase sigma-70 factor (ECF subfamily)
MEMAETEAVLLKRFTGNGDAQALAEIVRRHAGLVYGAALRILADVDRASDVAQETFLQLTKDAASVTGSLPGWLHRVATHKAIDQRRREASRRRREREYVAGGKQPRTATEWKEISFYVDVGLRELDPELRNVLILHFLEGRTTREIALAQGTSQATVSRRIGAGVGQLRAKLRRRGVLVAVGALSALLGDNAVQAAPLPLLTELGKMAMVGGAASVGSAGTGSGLYAAASGVLTAVKAKAVAVAAVAVITAGSAVTYYELTKPSSEPAATAPAESIASPEPLVFDSPLDSRRRVELPLNGPQAETPTEQLAAAQKSASTPGGEPPVAQPPVMDSPSGTTESVPASESAGETVMRLHREAEAGRSSVAADSGSPALTPPGPVVAKVDLKLVPPFRGCPGGFLGMQRQDTTIVKPAGMREMPPDAPQEPVYFVVRAGNREIQGTTYRSTRPGGPVLLLLDTDGDGLWSDEKAYVGRLLWPRPLYVTYEFGPVFLRQGRTEPGGDAFYADCSNGEWLTFWPAFYREGKVVLEGKTHRVVLVDADFDGRFNESFVPPAVNRIDPGCDVLAIDLDGDSGFFGGQHGDVPEIMPLCKLINVDGRYYQIKAAEDGCTVEFRRVEPQFGVLDLGGKAVELELWSNAGRQRLSGAGQAWRLPAGRYGVAALDLTEIEGGDRWVFEMFRAEAGQLKDFEIKPGRTTAFKVGPPFQIRASMERLVRNPDVTVGFELRGQAGELYSGAPKRNGKEPPEPSFKILNGAGQIVQSGRFAYS